MGLDSYLSKKTYVQRWEHQEPNERHQVTVLLGGQPHPEIKPERVSYITEHVAYWRKANQIHKWFVDNCQDGEDDCKEYEVEKEQLKQLVDACEKAKESLLSGGYLEKEGKFLNTETAEELLPVCSGFFFGDTNYDKYYLQDLESTIEQIKPLLSDEIGSFYYRASW